MRTRTAMAAAGLAAAACLASALEGAAQRSSDRPAPPARLQLRVSNGLAAVLDRTQRVVYRFDVPRRSKTPVPRFAAERLADASRHEVAAPPQLIEPTDIDIDPAGRIFVADAGTRAISYIDPGNQFVQVYSGGAIVAPIAIAAGTNGRVYVLDDARRQVVSLMSGRREPAVEYVFEGGFRPERLYWSAGTLWAVDARGSTVQRLFASNALAQQSDSGGRSLRPGESLTFRQMINASAIGVGANLLLALDPAKRRFVAYSAQDGLPTPIDYTWIMKEPAAVATDGEDLYFSDATGETLARIPALAPVTAYFEAGVPSENAVSLYSYLFARRLLPLRPYPLAERDTIAAVVTQLNLLPGGFTDSFERLFCQANRSFCVKGQIPAAYRPTSVLLPEVAATRYVGRRAQSLPIDPKKDPALARQRSTTLEDVSRFYAPITALQEETLRGILRDLNYTYRGANLFSEKSGSFIVPVDALRVRVLVPREDLDDPQSELNRLVSRNVTLVATSESPMGASADGAGADRQLVLPPKVTPTPDPQCEDYDPKTYTRVQELISFCVPKGSDIVSIAIVDNRFYSSHVEFKDRQNRTRLIVNDVETPNLIRHPVSDATSMNFDDGVDHGTHVAGIIAAADAAGEISGTHPRIRLFATDASKAKDLLSTVTALNVVNISLGRRPGDAQVVGPTREEKALYDLIADKDYRRVLFIVSAGNEGSAVAPGSLASLGTQSNVIVVGSSNWGAIPSLLTTSNRGAKYIHVVAPGEAIKSSLWGGGYGAASGSSQATAFVTGTAALLRSGVAKAWTPWQIKERILSTADLWLHGNAASPDVFAGMLNMKRALLDADHAVATMDADGSVVKGTIAAADKDKLLTITMTNGQAPVVIRYLDLRRFARNADGTRSILYSARTDPSDEQPTLLRLLDVSAVRMTPGDPQFVLELPDGTTQTIHLLELRDFVNVVF